MKSLSVRAFFIVINLLVISDCFHESRLEEFSFQCGQRPATHPERDNEDHVRVAYPGEWPSYGLVYHRKLNLYAEYACGGTLISEKHVITPRVCVTSSENGSLLDSGDVFFRIGTHKRSFLNVGYARHRNVSKIHQPIEYNATSKNELVILELSTTVKFNDYVQPACISKDFTFKKVIGWGLSEGNDYLWENNLQCIKCPGTYYCVYKWNRTSICNKDRGSVSLEDQTSYLINHGNKNEQTIFGIVDCTKPVVDQCDKSGNPEYEYITFGDYFPWIINITNLEYLQKIRIGQHFDPSKRYPNLLPRRNCGNVINAEYIKSYQKAQWFDYPWMAAIFGTGDLYVETGTLINQQYVLTAATVVTIIGEPQLIRLGEYDATKNPDCTENDETDCAPPYEEYEVAYSIIHPDYHILAEYYELNDIALIRTKKAVHYDEHIQPVCLPEVNELRQLRLRQYMHGLKWSGVLRSFSLENTVVIPINVTDIKYKKIVKGTNLNAIICSRENGYPSNDASVLGSIVDYNGKRFVQFAIKSSILAKEHCYTFIPFYMDWIIANMKP